MIKKLNKQSINLEKSLNKKEDMNKISKNIKKLQKTLREIKKNN